MTVDELARRLQELSQRGFGGHVLAVTLATREPRAGFISRLVAPSSEDVGAETCEPEARELPWLIAEPTDIDGTSYAPDYSFE